jgi:hypothetical protein
MQTEKVTLTTKEKRLLTAAVVLGLFYLAFQFGFMPYYTQYNEKTEQYEQLSGEWTMIEARFNGEDRIHREHDEALEVYEKALVYFERADADTDLSRMLTEYSRDNGFISPSQTLSEPVVFNVPGTEDGGASVFSAVTATMTFHGNPNNDQWEIGTGYAELKNLADAININRDVRITRFSYSPIESNRPISVVFIVILLDSIY